MIIGLVVVLIALALISILATKKLISRKRQGKPLAEQDLVYLKAGDGADENNSKMSQGSKEISFQRQLERDDFTLIKEIGRGNFGRVHMGRRNKGVGNDADLLVAVKTITGIATEKERADFMNEIRSHNSA